MMLPYKLMRLFQLCDSAFPVGSFSFSNGLETAVHEGVVVDAITLEEYVGSVARQAAFSDGVAALWAFRYATELDYDAVCDVDHRLILYRLNDEARQMTQRMGRKMAELSVQIYGDPMMRLWLDDIKAERTPGTYPVAQGMTFAQAGLQVEDLFCVHQYGVINMVLSAALRCMTISHYETQSILYRLCRQSTCYYATISAMTLDEICSFAPEMELFASLHEKGEMRMFMN